MKTFFVVLMTSVATAIIVLASAYLLQAFGPRDRGKIVEGDFLKAGSRFSEDRLDVTIIPGETKRIPYKSEKDLLVFSYTLVGGSGCSEGCELLHAEGTGREFNLVTKDGLVQSPWLGGVPPGYPGVPGNMVSSVTLKDGQRTKGEAYFEIDKDTTAFVLEYTGDKWNLTGEIDLVVQ